MPTGLKRYQTSGTDHAINFCCYDHRPYLAAPAARDIVERSLEQTRRKYGFDIYAYVVMPDHVHLLLSEPKERSLATAMQALKVSVSKQLPESPFWQDRYYDFNVITRRKFLEKLQYMHSNPVRAALVNDELSWQHSSALTYATGMQRTVTINLQREVPTYEPTAPTSP